MRHRHFSVRSLTLCFTLMIAGSCGSQEPSKAPALTPDEFASITRADIAYLQAIPEEGSPSQLRKLRVGWFATAVVLAHNAQEQLKARPDDAKQLATLRDAAVAIAKLLLDKDYENARAKAVNVSLDMKPDPKADPAPIELHKQVYIDAYDLMTLFRGENRGGLDLERKLRDAGSGRSRNAEDAQQLALQMIALAEVTHATAPERVVGRKDPADWKRFSLEMKEYGREAADALKAKDSDRAATAFTKVEGSCVRCHKVFR